MDFYKKFGEIRVKYSSDRGKEKVFKRVVFIWVIKKGAVFAPFKLVDRLSKKMTTRVILIEIEIIYQYHKIKKL